MFLGKCSPFPAWETRWVCAVEIDTESHGNSQAPIHPFTHNEGAWPA